MAKSIEARVQALEDASNAQSGSIKVIILQQGENKTQALEREGLPPDAEETMNVMFIEFVPMTRRTEEAL